MKNKINNRMMYIAFPDSRGKVVNEYIPSDASRIASWLMTRFYKLYIRYGIEVNYWNLRHVLHPEERKAEDLRFIIHVLEEHDGAPQSWREKRFYNRLCKLYFYDIRELIKPFLSEKKDINPIVHPYYLAYKKRWLRNKRANMKRLYHGVERNELPDMYDELIRKQADEKKNYNSKKSYYKKLLGKE